MHVIVDPFLSNGVPDPVQKVVDHATTHRVSEEYYGQLLFFDNFFDVFLQRR